MKIRYHSFHFIIITFLAPLLCVAQNLETVLEQQGNCTIFLTSIQTFFPELMSILSDRAVLYTLFVPTDDALTNSSRWTNANWNRHLNETLRNHFIPGELILQTALLERTSLQTMANTSMPITPDGKIAGSTIIMADQQAVNGVLHIIDRPLPTSFDNVTIADLIAPNYPHLLPLMNTTNSSSILSQESADGYSWIGCTEEAFNTIDEYLKPLEGASVLTDEFQNVKFENQTRENVFQFNMVPQIYDPESLAEGFLAISTTPCGNLWVTYKDGKLCFQDSCVVGSPTLANNGVALPADQCLVCPGIVMTASVDPNRTTLNTTDFVNVFRMTGWNERDLRPYFDGQSVTLFASINDGWAKFSPEDFERLNLPEWRWHLMDLITSQIAPGKWTLEDLFSYYKENGPFNLTMVNGDSLEIDYNEETSLLQAGSGDARGDFYLANMEGIDGLIHFTTHTPTADSLKVSLFEVVQRDTATYSQMLTYIQTDPTLKTGLELLSPRSIMMVPDSVWNRQQFSIDTDSIISEVINSHMFASVISCHELRQSAGSDVTSLNEKQWRVSVNDQDFPCLQYVDGSGAVNPAWIACISKCDIVAQNGMAFYLDNILLPPGVATQKPPSIEPTPAPSPSNFTAQPTRINEDIDVDQCFTLITTADEDGNGLLLRPEYNKLVAAYSETKCQDAPAVLSPNQQKVFTELACLCQERGEGESCCEGTNAGILFDDDDALKKELCQRVDRNAPGNFCNDAMAPAPPPKEDDENAKASPTTSPSARDEEPASGAKYSLVIWAVHLFSFVISVRYPF